jgi:hypothetical protein
MTCVVVMVPLLLAPPPHAHTLPLRYFMPVSEIQRKLASFAHSEYAVTLARVGSLRLFPLRVWVLWQWLVAFSSQCCDVGCLQVSLPGSP